MINVEMESPTTGLNLKTEGKMTNFWCTVCLHRVCISNSGTSSERLWEYLSWILTSWMLPYSPASRTIGGWNGQNQPPTCERSKIEKQSNLPEMKTKGVGPKLTSPPPKTPKPCENTTLAHMFCHQYKPECYNVLRKFGESESDEVPWC